MNSVSGGNYAGSSNYWGDLGSTQSAGTSRYGMGTPGARSRIQLANRLGVQALPQDLAGTGATTTGRYAPGQFGIFKDAQGREYSVDPRPRSTADMFEGISVTKNPQLDSAWQDLLKQYNATGKTSSTAFADMMDYYKNKAVPNMKSNFEQANQQLNLGRIGSRMGGINTGYENEMRNLLSAYGLTNQQATNQQNEIMQNRYSNLNKHDQYLADADRLARGQAALAATRFALGRGTNGLNSSLPLVSYDAYLQRMLPEYQRATAARDALMGSDIALRADQAAREASRFGFNAGAFNNIYGNQRSTEQYLNSLAPVIQDMGVQQAESFLRSMALPEQLVSQILSSKIANVGAIGNLVPAGRYEGLNYKPGANLDAQRWYEPSLPVYTGAPNLGGDNYAYPQQPVGPQDMGAVPYDRYSGVPQSVAVPRWSDGGSGNYNPSNIADVSPGWNNWARATSNYYNNQASPGYVNPQEYQ